MTFPIVVAIPPKNLVITFTPRRLMDYIPIIPTP